MVATHNYRILLVDDLADNLFLLKTFLESEGYQVQVADSAVAALALLKASPSDLILLDVMMPQMNGYELTRLIRQNDQLRSIPIILVTAHLETCRIKGLAAGATDFVRKPLDFEALGSQITNILERAARFKS